MKLSYLIVKNYIKTSHIYIFIALVIALFISIPVIWMGCIYGETNNIQTYAEDYVLGSDLLLYTPNKGGFTLSFLDEIKNNNIDFEPYTLVLDRLCIYSDTKKTGINAYLAISDKVEKGYIWVSDKYKDIDEFTTSITLLYDSQQSVTLNATDAKIPVPLPYENVGIISIEDAKELRIPTNINTLIPTDNLNTELKKLKMKEHIEEIEARWEYRGIPTMKKAVYYSFNDLYSAKRLETISYIGSSIYTLLSEVQNKENSSTLPLLLIIIIFSVTLILAFLFEERETKQNYNLYHSLGMRRGKIIIVFVIQIVITLVIALLFMLLILLSAKAVFSNIPVSEEVIIRRYDIKLSDILGQNGCMSIVYNYMQIFKLASLVSVMVLIFWAFPKVFSFWRKYK